MTNTIENTIIGNLTDEEIVNFVREFTGKTTIATLDYDADDKVIKETFDLDLSDFPLNAFAKYLSYGMQRVFNDAVGGADRWDSTYEKLDAVRDHIREFENGIVKKARTAGIAITNVAKLARQKARVAVKIMYTESKEHDYKRDFLSLTTVEQNEYLDSVLADDDQYTIAAQLEIDNRDKAKDAISLLTLPQAKS